mmetsp:Transcript_7359/g.18040  ORF Transcript_7359/g.18040 Transcript_7359/m.18040 type:complete len:83 (-) Transcript_7359:191-439(-)
MLAVPAKAASPGTTPTATIAEICSHFWTTTYSRNGRFSLLGVEEGTTILLDNNNISSSSSSSILTSSYLYYSYLSLFGSVGR